MRVYLARLVALLQANKQYLPLWVSAGAIVFFGMAAAFVLGVQSGASQNFAYRMLDGVRDSFKLVFSDVASVSRPTQFLVPSNYDGDGVTVNEPNNLVPLVGMAGFFDDGNEIRLIERDGTIVHRWPVKYFDIFESSAHAVGKNISHNWRTDIHGVHINPDGSVVFNFEYAGSAKLSACGDVIWRIEESTHHSVSPASGEGYWISGRRFPTAEDVDSFRAHRATMLNSERQFFKDDLILRVSENGEILDRKSVTEILYENGFGPFLSATGLTPPFPEDWDGEFVHINDIEELMPEYADAFEGLEAGDLIVSERTYNLVFIVSPTDWVVKWHRVGPWIRQHDPDFQPDGSITVYDNNNYNQGGLDSSRQKTESSRIVRVRPGSDSYEPLFEGVEDAYFFSDFRGKHEVVDNGNVLITEFYGGRLLELDEAGKLVWEYVNRYDEDELAEVTYANAYQREYFDSFPLCSTESQQ